VYSASSRFPLAEASSLRGHLVRYVRPSVKAVVDGVTGEVSLYVMRPHDPFLAAYRGVFPGLFEPLSAMPADVRGHIRYPRALFGTQARVLQAYHMTDPGDFYRKQDLWSIGQEVYEDTPAPVEPYFLLMPFPDTAGAGGNGVGPAGAGGGGATAAASSSPPGGRPAAGGRESAADSAGPATGEPEFLLTVPFTPRSRDNLSAFLLARNDGSHYGELWLFDISSRQQVFGPRQIEVQIDQDPVISQQLSLWRQRGSRAIRGHLLLLPVQGFLLYVEPLFLEAEDREGAAPGLKRVIAATGAGVTMATTLDGALERLLSGQGSEPAALPTETAGEGGATTSAPSPTLSSLRSLLDSADRALRAGDLVRFGTLWERIRSAAGTRDTTGTRGP
jgi:hypothetical protein